MSKFTVYTDKHEEFRWKFLANDESVVARSSGGFKRREDCLASVEVLRKDIAGATVLQAAAAPSKAKGASPKAPAPNQARARTEPRN
jgi:uncharacterized protein YegP (UPF0339 family)